MSMQPFDPEITMYRHYEAVGEPHYRLLSVALERIRSGKLREAMEHIRALPTKAERDLVKKQLPAAIFAGRCGQRADESMQDWSGLVVLDFDHVAPDFRTELQDNPFTYACWLSPSGTGLKALVRITDGSRLRGHFRHIEKYLWPGKVDASGKNPSRLCFESYDPDLYINADAQIYTRVLEDELMQWTERKAPTGSSFDKIISWLDRKGDAYVNGNRNNYIFKLAGACCRFGMDESDTINNIGQQWGSTASFSSHEMVATVRSAYKRNTPGSAMLDGEAKLVSRTGTREIDLGEPPVDGRVADVHYAKDSVEDGLGIKNRGHERSEDWGCPEMGFNPLRGQVNVIGGYGNVGKSALMTWMQLCYSMKLGTRWAIFGPETFPASLYYHEVVEMLEGTALHPKSGRTITDAQYRTWNEWVDEHFYYTYPEETPNLETILQRFLQLIIMQGVEGVVIDPWNQLDEDYTGEQRDDRLLKKSLDICKRFAAANNIYFFILAHPKNPSIPNGHKNYKVPEYSDLAGGRMWSNKTDNIVMYHRPDFLTDPDSTVCQVHRKKIKKPYATGGKRGAVELDFEYDRRRFMFGDRDPLGDLIRDRFHQPVALPALPTNYEPYDINKIPDDFWNE